MTPGPRSWKNEMAKYIQFIQKSSHLEKMGQSNEYKTKQCISVGKN